MKKSIISEKPAKGTRGILLRSINGIFFIRVYDHPAKDRVEFFKKMKKLGKKISRNDPMYKFTDYQIDHYDLDIKIEEKHASLYETEKGHFIDYDSTTLGLPMKK